MNTTTTYADSLNQHITDLEANIKTLTAQRDELQRHYYANERQIHNLAVERDELLAALKAAQPIVESVYLDDEANGKQDNARLGFSVNEQIKEAIAKAESNQT